MPEWKSIIDEMQNESNKNNDFILSLVDFQIGYAGWCVGTERYDEAEPYVDLILSNLEILRDAGYKPSYVEAYQGAIDGLRIGINSFLAIFLGPKVVSKAENAIELDSSNPNGYILLANSKYYVWVMLGGSKDEAIEYYRKAETIFEDRKLRYQSWTYLSLLTIIAQAYVHMEKYDDADKYYRNIIEFEPEYKWIKDEVYPQFLEKYGKR
ncbi:hypothetical protein OAO55_01795 [Bacteroidales bacterium]|nr:hypothetical protein [Bacteroidales bacterium]